MKLLALGINHNTAPVDIREQVSLTPEACNDALRELTALEGVEGAAILSTCNRTELYCELRDDDSQRTVDWLHRYHGLEAGQLEPYLYQHSNEQAVRHLLRVATGLDSLVLGEPQILGQMKQAYQLAREAHTLDPVLERLFQHTFAVAKQIRTETAIGGSAVSVAYAAVHLARQIFSDLSELTVLLVGAGETIELAARHLHGQGVQRLIIANRTLSRAQNLALEFNGYAIGLPQLSDHLHEADVIISSTGATEPVISCAMVEQAVKKRRHKPMFMVDIAVPRDIEPCTRKLPDVYLYTVDDLQSVIEEGMKSRRKAAEEAETMIDLQVQHYMSWLRSLDAVELIRRYRQQAEQNKAAVLEKARAMLERQPPEQVLEFLANTLTNKLLHTPSVRLREAAGQGQLDTLDTARWLLGLNDRD